MTSFLTKPNLGNLKYRCMDTKELLLIKVSNPIFPVFTRVKTDQFYKNRVAASSPDDLRKLRASLLPADKCAAQMQQMKHS